MAFKVRKADRRHYPEIARIIIDCNIGEDTIEKELKNMRGLSFWFIRMDGRIVGCMGAELIGNGTALLTHLAVYRENRRQGIGMTLFSHAIQFCRNREINTIAFITMYYHFRRFKKRGFRTSPRRFLPEDVKNHWMFTAKRYMKCAAMIQVYEN